MAWNNLATLGMYVEAMLREGLALFAQEDPIDMQIAKYDDTLRKYEVDGEEGQET